MIIGVDYHPSVQTIAFFVEETGECGEQELKHSDGEAERFYRDLQKRGIRVRVGMEATGYSRWFERLLAELGFEVWMGDPAEIKAKRVKKQKFDRLQEERIPATKSIGKVPEIRSASNRCCMFLGRALLHRPNFRRFRDQASRQPRETNLTIRN
jgi:transposase